MDIYNFQNIFLFSIERILHMNGQQIAVVIGTCLLIAVCMYIHLHASLILYFCYHDAMSILGKEIREKKRLRMLEVQKIQDELEKYVENTMYEEASKDTDISQIYGK